MLVREMVHLWQEMYGKPSNNGYFNREWAEKMEAIGLIPTSTGVPGGKRTGQGLKHCIEPNGRFDNAFREMPESYIWPFRPATLENTNGRSYSEKVAYCCIGCGTKVWGKSGLGLVCECGTIFIDASGVRKAGVEEKVYLCLAERYGNDRERVNTAKEVL